MKKTQEWKQQKGTFYAVNKQRKLTYRRVDDGAWQPAEELTREAVAAAEQVGWDRIDGGWFAVYRAS
ncbi:MAG: hypothetical protein NVSMB65_15880 [Chloroflexota bacterium]